MYVRLASAIASIGFTRQHLARHVGAAVSINAMGDVCVGGFAIGSASLVWGPGGVISDDKLVADDVLEATGL